MKTMTSEELLEWCLSQPYELTEEELGRIVLNGGRMVVEAEDDFRKQSLEVMIQSWRDGEYGREFNTEEKLFNKIPMITSQYSRLYFSEIRGR